MKYSQIADIMNDMTKQYLGEEHEIVQNDLSNVVTIGKDLADAQGYDIINKALVDRICNVMYMNRIYTPVMKSIYKDSFEYGNIQNRIYIDELPEAQDNATFQVQDGQAVDQDKVTTIRWYSKSYSDKDAWEVPITIFDYQIRSAFTSAAELAAFVSFIESQVMTSISVKQSEAIMACINNFVGEIFYDLDSTAAGTGDYSGVSGSQGVNLLKLYNATLPAGETPLTKYQFMKSPEAIRASIKKFKDLMDDLPVLGTKYNLLGKPRFTPHDRMKVYAYAPFINSAAVYLQSDVWHNELTEIPFTYEKTPFWQQNAPRLIEDATTHQMRPLTEEEIFDFQTSISIKTGETNHEVKASGILMIIADDWSMAVSSENQRTTSHYNAHGEYTNYWHKQDARYLNDLSQNVIVFFVA